MIDKYISPKDLNEPKVYEIRLRGHLNPQWSNWFEGLTISLTDDGSTVLLGKVDDQAALYGLLRKARDSGLPLLSVNCKE